MQPVFYLLCGFALLGGIDVAYFHIYRCKLYQTPSSVGEHLTHLIRAALFALALSWVMWVDASGSYALVLPLLLLVDFINSTLDVWLEPASRAPLGGLPPREYAVHMLAMFLSGATAALALRESARAWRLPTALIWRPLPLPLPARAFGLQVLLVTIGLCLFESVRFAHALAHRRKAA